MDEDWRKTVGFSTLPAWPVGQAAEGNKGVAALIGQTPNSLGYVELSFAANNGLAFGAVKNHAGKWVVASPDSVAAAARSVSSVEGDFQLIVDSPVEDAYPIASFTWMLVPKKISASPKRSALVAFLRWSQGAGQDSLRRLHYGKLPADVIQRESALIDAIQ